jgi:feruloyl esterase
LNNADLCFSWFSKDDINKGMGECESIYQMMLFMRRHYRIDSSRIFITGLSAGAAMSVVLMATHPESFKCGAVFAGGAYKMATNVFEAVKGMNGNLYIPKATLVRNVLEQNPDYKGSYPELIVYQGLSDPVVNYRNASFLVNQWTGLQGCDTIPDRIDSAFMNIAAITRKEYLNATGGRVVILYEIKDLGHRLLIKPGDKSDEGGQTGLFGVNRNFHSTFQTAKDFNIIRE